MLFRSTIKRVSEKFPYNDILNKISIELLEKYMQYVLQYLSITDSGIKEEKEFKNKAKEFYIELKKCYPVSQELKNMFLNT